MRNRWLIPALVFVATACGDDSGKETDETGDPQNDGVTIQDIQQGLVVDGESVTLKEVYLTSELSVGEDGFFIQEPGGGEYSGIYVYLASGMDGLDMDLGDVANIMGEVSEYYDLTEVKVSSINGIDIYDINSDLTTDLLPEGGPADWEPWEGCLVTIENVTTTSSMDNYGEMETDAGFSVNDILMEYELDLGSTCESITGLVSYGFGAYTINPRTADDLVNCSEGLGCPVATIAEVKSDPAAWEGLCVRLEGVVATSGVTQDGEGFFVQDAGGGLNSGMYVYDYSAAVTAEAGDVLNIEGAVKDYYDFLEITLSNPSDVENTGATDDPVVTPITSPVSDWEPYEGALVEVHDVQVTSAMDSYNEVDLSNGLSMNDLLYDYTVSNGDTFSVITGPLEFSFDDYKICPRSADDLVE